MIYQGAEVGWMWAGRLVTGVVLEVYLERHEILSQGKHIVRNGTEHDPALVIRHSKGSLVLKLQHEVQVLGSVDEPDLL